MGKGKRGISMSIKILLSSGYKTNRHKAARLVY